MGIRLADLASRVQGRVIGDGELIVAGAATLRDVRSGEITLVDHQERVRELVESPAAAVVATQVFEGIACPVLVVDDLHAAFAQIVASFRPPRKAVRSGVSPRACISPTARLGRDVDVHAGASIGDEVELEEGVTIHAGVQIMTGCKIGRGTTVFPNAVLYEDTVVGPRCLIHAGAVLGAHGFGYKFEQGHYELSPQLGHVELGADVEVGANSTIDRGTYGPTRIGEGTKIDNQVMIAHNCQLGRHNMICSQVGIAGSTTTGDYVVMAGQVGVRDHVHIGTGAVLGAMSGITNDVGDGIRMLGVPATSEREQKLRLAALSKLPEMRRHLKQLEQRLARLEPGGQQAAA